jgi:putative membrane protein insertion efficiency factor
MSTEFHLDHLEVSETEEAHNHDADPKISDLPLTPGNLPRIPLLLLIRLYQLTFSRTLPPNTCRFYPTCSHYGYRAVYKYGLVKGGLMAIWRVLRCNPFNPGGYDPVP